MQRISVHFQPSFAMSKISFTPGRCPHCSHSFTPPSCRGLSALLKGNLMVIVEGRLLSDCKRLFRGSSQLKATARWMESISFSQIQRTEPLNSKKIAPCRWQHFNFLDQVVYFTVGWPVITLRRECFRLYRQLKYEHNRLPEGCRGTGAVTKSNK